MRCKICGFNYIKPSDTCCPQCGVSVEDLKNVKEDFYKKNKIKRKRSSSSSSVITAAFIPILGFISYYKVNKEKNILITSIISSFFYLLILGCLFISFCVIKTDVYYLLDNKENQYSIKYKLTLHSLNRVQGNFKITGYEVIEYKTFIPQYDYEYNGFGYEHVFTGNYTIKYGKSKFTYKASGIWTQTKKEDVIKLLFTKEILKLNIIIDEADIIYDSYYKVYSSVIGKDKTNDLLDEKRVKLTYELGTAYNYAILDQKNKTFENYYQLQI